ncbi:MAG: hypothetical protein PHC29_00175 [Candidatus Omnitrophica bacterium]|nr:hypothetical protein [Candidatus Omnitrophota bacterium]
MFSELSLNKIIMKKSKKIKQERFHYSLQMEMAAWELYGMNKRHGMASAFQNCSFFKKECKNFMNKIRKRINQIVTTDELFRENLNADLDSIERELKYCSKNNNNDIDIIGKLISLVSHLLGWDHYEGDFYRTPMFYQTEDQKEKSLRIVAKQGVPSETAFRRRNIILQLHKEGLSYQQIGLILGITDSCAKQLEKASHLDKWHEEELKRKSH